MHLEESDSEASEHKGIKTLAILMGFNSQKKMFAWLVKKD